MSTPEKPLTEKQLRAIEAVVTERGQAAQAAKAGISKKTLARWMAQPEFMKAVNAAVRAILEEASRRAQTAALQAVYRLEDEMNATKPERGRVAAAKALLEHVESLAGLAGLIERIEALEERLNNNKGEPDESA